MCLCLLFLSLTVFLVTHCCQDQRLTKAILFAMLDGVLSGALEIFPTVDINALQKEKMSFMDKTRRRMTEDESIMTTPTKPPQFITTVDFLTDEL